MLMYPTANTDLIGVVLVALVGIYQYLTSKKQNIMPN